LVNGDEGKHVRVRSGGGPGDLAGAQKEVASWLARRKQETARRKEKWHGLAQQPGTHLRWEPARWVWRAELRTAEQQTIAAVRGSFGSGVESRHMTVSVPGGSFTGNKVEIRDPENPASWPPGIAEIIRHPEASSQKPTRAVRAQLRAYLNTLRELVDETGTPVLYTIGMHYDHGAGAGITFPDQRRLEFPVQGTSKAHAIMTAVDQDGNKVAQYWAPNWPRRTVEITVHPDRDLTDELVLVIAISARWFRSYFKIQVGGG
jgi:hypothetical protein